MLTLVMPRILCYIDIRGILPIYERKESVYVTVSDRMPAGIPDGIC